MSDTGLPQAQRGAALIMALLIAALVTTLASSLIWRENIWLGQFETRRDLAQTRLLLRAGVDWACAVLAEDARTTAYDHTGEPWANRVPLMPAEGGEVEGWVEDAQARWNLNNLAPHGAGQIVAERAVFERLLQQLQLPSELAVALEHWLAEGNPVAETSAQASNAAQRPRELTDLDNLRDIVGFTPEVIERLRPYVTVLPGYNPLNLNTANALTLAAVLDFLSPSEIQTMVSERQRIPYRDFAEFGQRMAHEDKLLSAKRGQLDTRSRYFNVLVRVRLGRAASAVQVLLARKNHWPEIVWQKYE